MGSAAYRVLITANMQLIERGVVPDFVVSFVMRLIVARRAAAVSSPSTLLPVAQMAVLSCKSVHCLHSWAKGARLKRTSTNLARRPISSCRISSAGRVTFPSARAMRCDAGPSCSPQAGQLPKGRIMGFTPEAVTCRVLSPSTRQTAQGQLLPISRPWTVLG